MNIQFVDRTAELEMLESFWNGGAGIFVLWGRRRVGKTRLLKEFAAGRDSLYLLATRETEKGILRNFSEDTGSKFGDIALKGASFDSFRDMLRYLGEKCGRPFLLVIDEFPYLCDANNSIPSILQTEWDRHRLEGIHVILSGSTVSAMESDVLGRKSPLYGRRTGQHKLQPMGPLEAKGFFPKMDREEYLRTYSIVGGTPEYLLKIDPDKDHLRNIMDNIAAPGAMLLDEPELLFGTEVREPKAYHSIMKALSHGKTTPNHIATYIGIPRTSIIRYLELLERLDLVEKRIPVTERRPDKTRRGRYYIKDPFFRFYFRFVFPELHHIKQGLCKGLEETVKKEFDTFMGRSFERIVEATVIAMEKKNITPFPIHKIGPWWEGEEEIDLVALNQTSNEILFIECKWADVEERDAERILSSLRRKAGKVKWSDNKRKEHFVIFARSFNKKIVEDDLILYELNDMGRELYGVNDDHYHI